MNAEVVAVDWFNADAALKGVPLEAFMDIPADRPGRFITVERTGGGDERWRGLPTLAVQVWAQYRYEAADLAALVVGSLRRMVALPNVARVEVQNVYNFPDPDSGQVRYQVTADLVVTDD